MPNEWSADWIRESMVRPDWQPVRKQARSRWDTRESDAPEPGRAQGLSREEWVELREQRCPACGESIGRHGVEGSADRPIIMCPGPDRRGELPDDPVGRRRWTEDGWEYESPQDQEQYESIREEEARRRSDERRFRRDLVLLNEAWMARPEGLPEGRGGARGRDPDAWMDPETRRRLRESERRREEYDRNVRAAHTRNEAMIAEAMERRRDFVRSWEAKGWQGQAEARKSDPEGYRAFQEQQAELRHYERKRRAR